MDPASLGAAPRAAWRILRSAGALLLDRSLPAGPQAPPFDLSGVDAAWLTRALEPIAPGVRVAGFERLDQHSGTTTRARLALRYHSRGAGAPLPDTLFLKIAPAAPAQRLFTTLYGLGRSEVAFYRSARPGLPVRAPRIYAACCSGDGRRFALLLEDLAAAGARFATVGERMSAEEAQRTLTELARLHAAFWESPRFQGDLAWLPCRESRRRDLALDRFLTGAMLGVAVRRFAADFPPEFRRLARVCVGRRAELEALWARGPRTLVHGDCHLGNLFFEGEDVGFLDWQVVARAPALRDVSYLLCSSLPAELRREHERALIEGYLARLAAAGAPAPDFESAWRQHRLFAAYAWLAAAFTSAAGGGLQAPEIARAGLRRATRAAVELGTLDLLERELGGA